MDALRPPPLQRFTWGGTLSRPWQRLAASFELIGAVLVAAGSGLLLFNAANLSTAVVLIVVAGALLIVYVTMTWQLRAHMRLLGQDESLADG